MTEQDAIDVARGELALLSNSLLKHPLGGVVCRAVQHIINNRTVQFTFISACIILLRRPEPNFYTAITRLAEEVEKT